MILTNKDRFRLLAKLRRFLSKKVRTSTAVPALIVAATLVTTPEAAAQIKDKKATPVLIMEKSDGDKPKVFEKVYTKEELQDALPDHAQPNLAERILDEINGLLTRMWVKQKKGDERERLDKLLTETPTEEQIKLHVAAMKDEPETRHADGNRILKQLSRNMKSAASDLVKDRVSVIDKVETGVKFDVNLSDVFSSKSTESTNSGKIRYGLVLKNIVPSEGGDNRAAIADTETELKYAGHADVVWTIGPIEESHGRRMFTKKAMPTESDASLWDSVKLPSMAFTGNVNPELGDIGSMNGLDKLPNWTLNFSQKEDYYSLLYRAKSNGERISAEHSFRIPIFGELSLGRRFDDQWHVIQTSAYNILIDKRAPALSIHYMNMEQRYTGTLSKNYKGHQIDLSASSEGTGTAPEGIRKKKKTKEYMSEKYSIGYSKKF